VVGNEKNRGGGLLTGIRKTIPYREIKRDNLRDKEDGITEWQTIEIPLAAKEKWRITNIYIPSERTGDERGSQQESVVSTKHWPTEEFDMIAGDVNAHSPTWDDALERESNRRGLEVKRGEMIDEWSLEKNMMTLNDGTATHTNRRTGKESAPDITAVHAQQADRYEWKVLEKLGGSDHKPILITRHVKTRSHVNNKTTYKWNLAKADFKGFREEVERKLPKNYEGKNLNKLEKILRKTIIKAANKHVKKKEITRDSKPVISKEIKEKIRERNKLRKNITTEPEGRKKWIESCKMVNELIRKEKEESWKEYVVSLDAKTNPKDVWKTIRNLDGRYSPRKDNEV
jgi:hypothetical protein